MRTAGLATRQREWRNAIVRGVGQGIHTAAGRVRSIDRSVLVPPLLHGSGGTLSGAPFAYSTGDKNSRILELAIFSRIDASRKALE